ncbi:MAG: hypothetical protein AB1791_01660 [Chloroflexota bacterium]
MRRAKTHGFWTRILLVLCLICQVIGSAVAQEPDPYPDEGEGLPEADPADRQVAV